MPLPSILVDRPAGFLVFWSAGRPEVRGGWWVLTNPTNLYSQETFPSLDYIVTFHIGLTARIAAREARSAPPSGRDRLLEAWRRWEQASEELDRADEAEEFQAIGMRCHECLISFIRSVTDKAMVPAGQEAPKGADFKQWSGILADAIAAGSRGEQTRAYLKATSRTAWDQPVTVKAEYCTTSR